MPGHHLHHILSQKITQRYQAFIRPTQTSIEKRILVLLRPFTAKMICRIISKSFLLRVTNDQQPIFLRVAAGV